MLIKEGNKCLTVVMIVLIEGNVDGRGDAAVLSYRQPEILKFLKPLLAILPGI